VVDNRAQHGDIEKAEENFERLRSAGEFPDLVTFNSLSDGCAKHGDVGGQGASDRGDGPKYGDINAAEEIFASLVPDGVTFNSLIDGCAEHGEVERTEEIFDTMKTAGVVPNVATFNKIGGGAREAAAHSKRRHAAGPGKSSGAKAKNGASGSQELLMEVLSECSAIELRIECEMMGSTGELLRKQQSALRRLAEMWKQLEARECVPEQRLQLLRGTLRV
jgi:pentatricopeptide repeat protein